MKELTGTKTWITTSSGKRKCKARVAGKYLGLFESEEEADVVIGARIDELSERGPKTCRSYVEAWFEAREKSGVVKEMTQDRSAWRACIEGARWLEMEPNAVEATHIQTWLTALAERPGKRTTRALLNGVWVTTEHKTNKRLTSRSLSRALARVRLFFLWLRSMGIRSSKLGNPAEDLIMPAGRKVPRTSAQRVVHLTAEEIEKLFEQPLPIRTRALYAIAIYAGLRKAEILGLQWQYVDFKTRRFYVRDSRTGGLKTRSSLRDVPMLPFVHDVLQEYLNSHSARPIAGPVFPAKHRKLHNKDYDAQWADTIRGKAWRSPGWRTKAGIRGEVTFQCFRHTCACQLLQGTVLGNAEPLEMHEVSLWLGHSSISVTQQHYAEYSQKNLHTKALGLFRPRSTVETKVETTK